MTDPLIPYLVGNLGREHNELKNTYFVTESGLLIPHTRYFFTESYGNRLKDIRNCMNSEKSTSKEKKAAIKRAVSEGKRIIDEILIIVDHENSFGEDPELSWLVNTSLKGEYLNDTKGFFNTENLRELYRRIGRIYDPKSKHFRKYYDKYSEFESFLRTEYAEYFDLLFTEVNRPFGESPLPRGLGKQGIRFK